MRVEGVGRCLAIRPLALWRSRAGYTCLLSCLLAACGSIRLRRANGVPLYTEVLNRAVEQLTIAESAHGAALQSDKGMLVNQQEHVAIRATEDAEAAVAKTLPVSSKAKEAVLETQMWAEKAQHYADHAKEVVAAAQTIAADAAGRVDEYIAGWIREDAYKEAERAEKSKNETEYDRTRKIAGSVAAAAEPYHLALLRAQKFVEETYTRAKSARESTQKLSDEAKRLANNAQGLQASGLGVQAQQMMLLAHDTMNKAVEMKTWSEKLYDQASRINDSIGRYQLSMSQAAANAQATTFVNPSARLPPMFEAALR